MFSNIGSDANIDWASLAQQWIQRNTKNTIEESNFQTTPPIPPPPILSNFERRGRNYAGFDEKGEADMEMDDDELAPPPPSMTLPTSPSDFPIHPAAIMDQTPDSAWSSWMNPPMPAIPQEFPKTSPTAHIPSLMKINVPNPNDSTKPEEIQIENTSSTIDAAKRKVLPAWIREGLEKMEREKQKQLEREQQFNERKSEKTFSALLSPTQNAVLTVKDHVKIPLESDGSSGNDDDDNDDLPYKLKSINKSKHIGNVKTAAAASKDEDDAAAVASAFHVSKPYEQRLAELMIAVRRTLTELLLEVTNEEISQIAKETLHSSKLKASSAQVIRKSALSSITNRLGLAAYSSSSDDSESDNSDGQGSRDDSRRSRGGGATSTAAEDSEEEIKAKLRVRRRAFAKTAEEIEERIAANAAREEQKLFYYKQQEKKHHQQYSKESDDEDKDDTHHLEASSSTHGYGIGKQSNNARDFGETTTESKLQQSNGKKSKERTSRRGERTTRFSDNKDSKNVIAYMTQINAAAATANTTTTTTNNAVVPPVTSAAVHGFQTSADVKNNLQNLYVPTGAAAAGINSMLSAAEAAIEKATKSQSRSHHSTSSLSSRRHGTKSNSSRDPRERERRRRRRHKREHSRRRSSESSSSSSSNNSSASPSSSSSSSSDISRNSKYSRASSNKRSSNNHGSSKNNNNGRYYDDHRRQRRNDHHHHERDHYEERSKSHRHTSSSKNSRSRDRSRSRSRSRSTYSSSSSKRRQHRRH